MSAGETFARILAAAAVSIFLIVVCVVQIIISDRYEIDYILRWNLETCARMLRNGTLSHEIQQETCAELIEGIFE